MWVHPRNLQFCSRSSVHHFQWFRTSLWEGQPLHAAMSNRCMGRDDFPWSFTPQTRSVVVEVKCDGWELWIMVSWVVTPWSNVGKKEKVTEPFLLQLMWLIFVFLMRLRIKKNYFLFFHHLSSMLQVKVFCRSDQQGTIATLLEILPIKSIACLYKAKTINTIDCNTWIIHLRVYIICSHCPNCDLLCRGNNSVLWLVKDRL